VVKKRDRIYFMTNIERKIKLEDSRKVIRTLKKIGARFEGKFIERDTFYNCPNRRLKLREINNEHFKLIFYDRPNVAGSKMSEYWTVGLDSAQAMTMKIMLGDALGNLIQVKKKRKLWMYENTRIHIDHVEGLHGVFLELESAVDEIGQEAAREEHGRIINLLEIGSYIPLPMSYADMLLELKRVEAESIPARSDDKGMKKPLNDEPAAPHLASHPNSEKIMEAYRFAAQAHAGQVRKGTTIPYITHPFRVAKILIDQPCSEEAILAGLLHDTVEDTAVDIKEIRASFGEEVAAIVESVSEPDKSAPWEERKEHTINHLLNASMDAVLVSCADKLDNLLEMYQAYKNVGEDLWNRFRRPRGKQEWYYRSLGKVFKERMVEWKFKPLLHAYLDAMHTLFG